MAAEFDQRLTQQAQIGSIYGIGQSTQSKSEAEHETASRQWADAWLRLKHAEVSLAQADQEAIESRERECAAWNALECVAGRGGSPLAAKQAACDPRRY